MGGFQSLLYLFIIYSVVSGRCPDSSRGQTKKYGGTCLEFIKDEVRQPEAVSYCTRQGGHLVTVENRRNRHG
ncbi:hypothetical protein EB796_009451 [Bugula neritina]|uniref:Uncharacterized protein n=1 Tax=Bugula neritina TaxID=10212 RepID=A0A7J7K0T5_BUGNE|nr:hypothetical protein EB796_009451 [Bugula neritina]